MPKLFIILLLALITTNCKGITDMKTSTWKIQQNTIESPLFKEGMKISFSGNSINLTNENHTNKYPAIVTNERMVIETEYTKWLFEIVPVNDSTIFLKELYTKNPLEIRLLKINNLKNKKS